jgi:hypothetical protein
MQRKHEVLYRTLMTDNIQSSNREICPHFIGLYTEKIDLRCLTHCAKVGK